MKTNPRVLKALYMLVCQRTNCNTDQDNSLFGTDTSSH